MLPPDFAVARVSPVKQSIILIHFFDSFSVAMINPSESIKPKSCIF